MPLTIALSIVLSLSQPATPVETVIKLNVHPMAAPKPALRYLLLPELKDLSPGNAIEGYLKCFLDEDLTTAKEFLGRNSLKQADRAARLDKADWQILPKLKTDGIGLLLPDIQKHRFLAACLQERFRSELTQGQFDDAIITAQTMFALSRHMGEHPTLIGSLVGIAIAAVAIGPLEEMLQEPGCPNLYWALTNLPNPLVSIARGLEGERIMIGAELKDLSDKEPMTAVQLKKVVDHIDWLRDFEERPRGDKTQAWLNKKTSDPTVMAAARKRLIEYGIAENRLSKFPAEQIILIDERREYEVRRDEVSKLMNLPSWELEERLKDVKPEKDKTIFGSLLPALHKVRRAQTRLEQRIAMLRHVEAIRIHAAEHQGRLPEKLGDISVPLPVDPFTGKPFRYSLEGGTAHLRGTPPPGGENQPYLNLHYVITIAKPK